MPSGRREGAGEHPHLAERTQEKNMRQHYVSSHSDRWGRSGMGPGPPENEATWSPCPWGGQISPQRGVVEVVDCRNAVEL